MSQGQWGGGPPQGPGGGWPPAPGGAPPGSPNTGAPNSPWGAPPNTGAQNPGAPAGGAAPLPPTQMSPAFPPGAVPSSPGGASPWGAPPAPPAPQQPGASQWGAPAPSAPFGSPPASPTGGAFGAPPGTGPAFGSPPASPTGGAFGAPAQSSPFGQPQQSNAFGQPGQGGGAFGQPGGSAFGQPAGGAFGQPQQPANPFGGGGPFANAPRSNMTWLRTALPVAGVVVMLIIVGVVKAIARNGGSGIASTIGAGNTQRIVADRVSSTFRTAMNQSNHASELCGFRVQSVTNVAVSNIQTSGSSVMGSGFATVSGTPVYMPGVQPVPGPCTGNYSFNYRITHRWVGRTDYINTNLDDTNLYRPMQVGASVQGALLDGDFRTSGGQLVDDYGVNLQAGQTITVLVRGGPSYSTPGQNLDMTVAIVANTRVLASDDDSAGNLNARVVFTAPAAGLYFIRVSTALRGTQMGTYTVQTLNGANPTAI